MNKSKESWKREEDDKLLELIDKFGTENWKNITIYFKGIHKIYILGRNYKQLKDHYENYLRPNLNKK
jgi:hypothetical protein